jgi:hypothetical protein
MPRHQFGTAKPAHPRTAKPGKLDKYVIGFAFFCLLLPSEHCTGARGIKLTKLVNTLQAPAPEAKKLAYTAAELCAALSISAVTLWRLEKRGLLRAVPGVRHKIYSADTVHRFLAGKGIAA